MVVWQIVVWMYYHISMSIESLSRGDVLQNINLNLFRLERTRIPATEIFSKATAEKLKNGRQKRAQHEKDIEEGHAVDHPITTNLCFAIKDTDIVGPLAEQRITGAQLEEQADALLNTPLLKEIEGVYWTETRHRVKKMITKEALQISRHAAKKEEIALRHGGEAQIKLTWMTFMNEWEPGIDLYKPLRRGYEAYHAQMVGFLPESLLEVDMSALIRENQGGLKFDGQTMSTTAVIGQEYLGLYPTILVDKKALAPTENWVSQDQKGRFRMADRILEKVAALVDDGCVVTIIDYAGGVGNSTAAMVERIEKNTNPIKKQKLMDNFRVVIRDFNEGQLEGGRLKFEQLEREHPWIKGRYVFIKSDVTKSMDDEQKQKVKDIFGEDFDIEKTTNVGMTSYTIGALPGFVTKEMAKRIREECYYFTAIDFSNPAFEEKKFLEQTGEYGLAYLAAQHGKALKSKSAFKEKWVRAMSLGAGLAMHYNFTWPGEWGHNAGYGVKDNGDLRMASIQELAADLNEGILVRDEQVRSSWEVNSFSYIYTGRTTDAGVDKVRLAVIPGWAREDIEVTLETNKKSTTQG